MSRMSEHAQQLQRQGLSVAEAVHVSGLGRTRLYEAMSSGALKARKYGKRRIILYDDLIQFLASLPTIGGTA
jgi:Helix-turn-helix domain